MTWGNPLPTTRRLAKEKPFCPPPSILPPLFLKARHPGAKTPRYSCPSVAYPRAQVKKISDFSKQGLMGLWPRFIIIAGRRALFSLYVLPTTGLSTVVFKFRGEEMWGREREREREACGKGIPFSGSRRDSNQCEGETQQEEGKKWQQVRKPVQ